jgi:hypothetical protein
LFDRRRGRVGGGGVVFGDDERRWSRLVAGGARDERGGSGKSDYGET